MSLNDADLRDQLRRILQNNPDLLQPSGGSSTTGTSSVSSLARSLRGDASLANDISSVLNSSRGAEPSLSRNPILPSLHRSSHSTGRFVPYGRRKKKECRTYDMKLAVINYIPEAGETGETKRFNGDNLIKAPFRVRELEMDADIRKRILDVIKSRYDWYDGSFYYASRTGRSVLKVSPCQTLDGKAVYTIKSKSKSILYVMLSKPVQSAGGGPIDQDEEEEDDDQDQELGLLRFSRTHTSPFASRDLGHQFRNVHLPTTVPGANSPEGDDSLPASAETKNGNVTKLFSGHDKVQLKNSSGFQGIGFFNPDGKSCSIAATLSLLQYIKPVVELVKSRKGALCELLDEIYQVRGLRDKRIAKPFNSLRAALSFPEDEDIDANEFLHKLLVQLVKHEECVGKTFGGSRKEKITLDSSASGEITLEQMDVSETDATSEIVHVLGIPPLGSTNGVCIRDLLSQNLLEHQSTIPYSDLSDQWKEKYPDSDSVECKKRLFYDVAPRIAVLTLQRGEEERDKKDNRPVQVPRMIPTADFTHPEDEGIHSTDIGGGTLLLFGMIVHSEERNHNYALVHASESSSVVHDDLKAYELQMTDDLLKDVGGGDRRDSSTAFIYIDSRDLIVEKPPLPDKAKQRDILKRLGSTSKSKNSEPECVIVEDGKEVDYQGIFLDIEDTTKAFVGLEPLKQQFLRFAKTAILNQKRKRLGFKVGDMNTAVHFIFQGNPGTGKTTFARKVADLLYSIKKIKRKKVVEVQRGDLVGQYIGSTEDKTAAKISEAKGGVLFVDEAYRLTPRSESVDYGQIAINQLMAAMEKGDPVMIFAGYPKEMSEFLKANPGLNSRIKYKFDFTDYSVAELGEILSNSVNESGFLYRGSNLEAILEKETTTEIRSQQNGRLVKNILAEAITNLSNRLSFKDTGEALVTLEDEDFIQACRLFCKPINVINLTNEEQNEENGKD